MEERMLRAINRWKKILIDIFADKIKVDENGKYPARWEPIIQEAAEAKRNGDFLFAIELYLSLIEVEKTIHPEVLYFFYKPILCAGRLDFAYQVITVAELYAKMAWGPVYIPNMFGVPMPQMAMPWVQETRRKELEEAFLKCSENMPTGVIQINDVSGNAWTINRIKERLDTLLTTLKEIMEKYSGGAKITMLTKDEINEIIPACLKLYKANRQNGLIKD